MGEAVSGIMLALAVTDHSDRDRPGDTWLKPLDTPFPPAEGERVACWPYEDDPADGFELLVADRWWAVDGTVWCSLQALIVDPNELEEQMISDVRSSWHRRHHPWRTAEQLEGEERRPEPYLEAAGWTKQS